jgi:hypothetical protein
VAATISLRVYTSTNAATLSTAQTGIDMVSADGATNSLANRQLNPITAGTRSYEKWLKLMVDVAPANAVTNFQIWGDGAVDSSMTLFFTGNYITGATPVASASSKANANFTTYTAGNKATWDASSYSTVSAATRYVVFQLSIDSDRGPGPITQETISYSWDET